MTDTTATLTWNAVDGASKYVVTNGSNVQNTNTNSIIFTDLAPNQTYNFTITSYNGGVLEGGSYLISGILTGISAPATITSTSISKDSITLSWDSVDGATDYYISEPTLDTRIVQGTSNVFEDLIDAKRILREMKLLYHLGDHENIIEILDVMTMPAV